jgi:hypothetical protein
MGQVSGTLIRYGIFSHPLASTVRLLALRLVAEPFLAVCVPSPRRSHLCVPRRLAARLLAVPVAAIAPRTEEEHLTTGRPTADDEAK